jgi:cytochrome c oxidase subunit IV
VIISKLKIEMGTMQEEKEIKIKFSKGKHKDKVILQILIMILSTFAFSFIIYETIKEIKPVSAVDSSTPALNCCEKTKNGATCQDIINSNWASECDNSSLQIPTKCEQDANCRVGCCIDNSEGTCIANTPRKTCVEGNGTWKEGASCNLPECSLGCCMLGENTAFVTDKRCSRLSLLYGFQKQFKSEITAEIGCIALSKVQETGACVLLSADSTEKANCKFTSKQECASLTHSANSFHKDMLCSNPDLNTKCEKQKTTGCVDEKDEVYWFDSCGNRENIYSSNKATSWNNGLVLAKNQTCGANSDNGNANSASCGNCDYFLGSKCGSYIPGKTTKPTDGNFICRDVNCIDSTGKKRLNGESWCVYDGSIGKVKSPFGGDIGSDVVGSRHFKEVCINGEVQVEPCADYRNEICVESDMKNGTKTFSNAACIINGWQKCIAKDMESSTPEGYESDMEECKDIDGCFVKEINVPSDFKFKMCVPKYPPGFDLKSEGGQESAKKLCSLATQKCTVIYEKKISGWKCIANCDCEKAKFTQQMNDLCISLGDCGGYVNIEGKTDAGYSVSGAPKIDLSKYKKYAQPVPGQKADPGNVSKILEGVFGVPTGTGGANYKPADYTGAMLAISGVAGVGIATAAAFGAWTAGMFYVSGVGASAIWTQSLGWYAFGNAAIGAAIAMAVALVMTKLFGLQGDAAMIMMVVGMIGAAVLIVAVIASSKAAVAACVAAPLACPIFIGVLIVIIIIALILKVLGIGKIKKVIVTFSCKPWQAPTGGSDCDKCNGDIMKPCSQYRCESLGQTCSFINEGTTNEMCIDSNPSDASAPVISPDETVLLPGYKYAEVSSGGFKIVNENDVKGCVEGFNAFLFGIKTNEVAQCKMDTVHTDNYDSMEQYFGDDNMYMYNHTMPYMLPSVDSLGANGVSPDRTADLNLYVRCMDTRGNKNAAEYNIRMCIKPGPDKTPPMIISTDPTTGSILPYITANSSLTKALTVYINEPAECKFSKTDGAYDLMENTMSCNTDLFGDMMGFGWTCNANLTSLTNSENKFYIRCKDQPWYIGMNETLRNKNEQSYVLVLKGSASPLTITRAEPNNQTIKTGTVITSLTLYAETSGGAENGKSECYYSFTRNEGSYIQFFNTYSTTHSQTFNQLITGSYNIGIKCSDIAGNSAEASSMFTIEADNSPPIVTRAYNQGGNLKIITDEKATCYYSYNTNVGCGFDIANATSMSDDSSGLIHTSSWNTESTYYIKCKDEFQHYPGGCSIIARPYNLLGG